MRLGWLALLLVACSGTEVSHEGLPSADLPKHPPSSSDPGSAVPPPDGTQAVVVADAGVIPTAFTDGFEADTLAPSWRQLVDAGSVRIASGKAHAGSHRLVTGFGPFPASGRARIAMTRATKAIGTRAWVFLPVDGYPPVFGLATIRLASGAAVDVVVKDDGHTLTLVSGKTEAKIGTIVQDTWTCVALSVADGHATSGAASVAIDPGPAASFELGATYAGAPNPNSMGISFDDVTIDDKALDCQ